MRKLLLQRGFTIIETLVAISVLLMAIIAPMTIAARGLQSAYHAREHLTAVFLAQEGVELVRMYRDDESMKYIEGTITLPTVVLSGSYGCFDTAKGCGIAITDSGVSTKKCDTPADCRLNFHSGSGEKAFYSYKTGGIQSPFTRIIKMSQVGSPPTISDEVSVEVEVRWRSGLFQAERSVVLRSTITDRYKIYASTP